MRRLIFLLTFLISVAFGQYQNFDSAEYLKKLHQPKQLKLFKLLPHLPSLNQDTTSACWAFATTSFLESEMQRLQLDTVRLSMMFPFFHVYVEKVRRFVQTHGQSRVSPGDLFTGVLDMVQQYGIVPYQVYSGLPEGKKTYNQHPMYFQIDSLLQKVKAMQLWDEDLVLYKTRQILYKHMGVPPQVFEYRGQKYTPKSFLKKIVRLPWNDYVMVTSFQYAPYYQFVELKVPDNWLHHSKYFNVPLDEFYQGIKLALKRGYSVAFDSDIGEPGRQGKFDATFVVPFDIPGRYIDANARELRFNNKSTTDDHLMHFVGFARNKGDDWFLAKDSWRTAWEGMAEFNGYFMFHKDYVKLKVLAYLVHKDAIPEITKKINQQKQ